MASAAIGAALPNGSVGVERLACRRSGKPPSTPREKMAVFSSAVRVMPDSSSGPLSPAIATGVENGVRGEQRRPIPPSVPSPVPASAPPSPDGLGVEPPLSPSSEVHAAATPRTDRASTRRIPTRIPQHVSGFREPIRPGGVESKSRRMRRLATLFLCGATAACAAGPYETTPAEVEEPLELSIESVTLRRGGVRLAATMTDGSADVSVWPGPSCRQREIGRGIATSTDLAWTLTAEEIAVGLECGLVVRARTRDDEGRRVVRVATLPVAASLESDEPGARASVEGTHGAETRITFLTQVPARRIHVGGLVVGADAAERPGVTTGRLVMYRRRTTIRLHRSTFEVGNDDLARAVVQQRPIGVGGASFEVLVSIGGTMLDLEKPDDA